MDQNQIFRPNVYHIAGVVMDDPTLQPLDVKVYGVIYWLDQMNPNTNQGCFASNKTLANIVNSSSSGVANSLVRLSKAGHIHIILDENNHRVSMKAMVVMANVSTLNVGGGYSNEEGGVTQMSNRTIYTKNNIYSDLTESDKDDEATKTQIDKIYTGYLLNFIIDKDDYQLSSKERRQELLARAKKKYRLTDKRRSKIRSRLDDAGYEMVKQAIVNCAKSDWHRGKNDNGWFANIDWICNSYEKVEEWCLKG